MNWLLNLLTGGAAKVVLEYLGKKDEGAKEIALAQIASNTEANKLRAALAPQFQWLIYALTVPCALHFGLIVLDSCIWGSWHMGIPALPKEYAEYEKQIILSFFILQPVNTAAKGLLSWLHK